MTLAPPRIATWLLLRLASGPRRESLIGDLIERHQQKRSTAWYWQQVLVAIVLTNVESMWGHKTLALRAIVVGWCAMYAIGALSGAFLWAAMPSQQFDLRVATGSWLPFVLNPFVLLGHVHTAVVRVATGWLVARSHRPYQTSMVFAFLASFLILDLPWLFRGAIDAVVVGDAPVVAMFINHLVSMTITVTGVMVGLMWSSRGTNDRTASSESLGA